MSYIWNKEVNHAHCRKKKGYFNQIGLPQLHNIMVFVPDSYCKYLLYKQEI